MSGVTGCARVGREYHSVLLVAQAMGRGTLTAERMAKVTGAVAEWQSDVVQRCAVRVGMRGGVGGAPADLNESLRQRIQKTELLQHRAADARAQVDDLIPKRTGQARSG